MTAFGRSPFPRAFGGGPNTLEIEHQAMLDALSPAYDVSEDSAVYAETYAHACAVTMIWRINGRLRNQMIPTRMMETLPTWEEACRLRPSRKDSVHARRAAVAAKMLGMVDNTLSAIYDVCATMLGNNFLGLETVASGDETTYWPGINPGPPGFEWSSNRAMCAVRVQVLGLTNADFRVLVEQVYQRLAGMCPAWMAFQIGTDDGGFIAGVGIAGLTLL